MIKNKDLIITRTPLRVSLFGGGTDIPYFYKKTVRTNTECSN